MRHIYLYVLMLSLLWMTSCRTITLRCPKAFGQVVEVDTVTVVEIAPPVSEAEVSDAPEQVSATLETNSLDTLPPVAQGYQWLTYRGKADVTDPEGTRTCNFYMVNRTDSILYLNLHASGIEFIRVVCTPDSFIYVNKLKYEYYKGSYEPLQRISGLPMDFSMIQSVLNGTIDEETEAALRAKRWEVTPSAYAPLDSARSFFTELTLKDLNRLVEIHAVMKLIRLDVPGPTAIHIPDRFKELKMP